MAHATSCPYVGLQPYTEDDRQFFFGREREQRIISANLYASPLTVVYGASGVGKSSILRAGVVPYLQAAERTTVVYFNQWQDPSFADRLKADCLKAVAKTTGEPISVDTSKPLHKFLAALGKQSGSALLILLDQFEEYFLYHPENNGGRTFDGEFASAVNQGQAELGFMISLRDDWLSRLDRFQRRIPNLLGNTYRLEYLTSAAAEEAIRKPLEVHNAAHGNGGPVLLEDELVQEVLAQVRTGEVNLSESQGSGQAKGTENADRIETAFLQLVMTRLWNKEMESHSNLLRVSTLRQLGGAKQIVQSHLDNVLSTLPSSQQDMCASMFRYLVTPRGSKIAHETADLVEFAEHPAEEVKPLLEKLADPSTHLLRRMSQPERYEIFHDVLGPAVLDWRTRYNKEQEKVELAKQAEAEAQRQNANRFRRLSAALAVLFLVAVVMASIAWRLAAKATHSAKDALDFADTSKTLADVAGKAADEAKAAKGRAEESEAQAERASQEAINQTRKARSQQLAAEALVKLVDGGDHDASLLLARDAVRITFENDGTVLPDVEEALRRTVRVPSKMLIWPGHSLPDAQKLKMAAFSHDGAYVATASFDHQVELWDRSSGAHVVSLGQHSASVEDIQFSPDSHLLATASRDGLAKIWDVDNRKERFTLIPNYGSDGKATGEVLGAVFSPDSKWLATASTEGITKIWDVDSGKVVKLLSRKDKHQIEDLAFDPDGRRMAIVAEKTEFWDISGEPKILDKQPKPASLSYSVSFSPDGRYLVAPSEEGMKLWNAKARKWDLLPGGLENANWLGVAISPDKTVASSGKSGTIVIWDLGSATELTTAYAGKSVLKAMAFSPDGKSLYTLGEDWQIYTHPAHTKDLIVEATEQIAAGKGPWVLNTKICKELLHEPCPQEVLALDKKNVASREKIIK